MEELTALERLLHAAQPYCSELDITLLFSKHRLPLPLDGDTPEERMEDLIHKCSDIFEAVVASDDVVVPIIDFTFVRWFSQVFSTEFSAQRMLKELGRVVRKKYYSSKG